MLLSVQFHLSITERTACPSVRPGFRYLRW